MKQISFAEGAYARSTKTTRKQIFLGQMERVVPWTRLIARIEPRYPVAGNGRQPFPLPVMLRIHLMQQWFGYSDPAMEEALHDIPLLRRFAGLDSGDSALPDESTILRFRHLLEQHDLAQSLFAEVTALLCERGLMLRQGTIVDATLIAAPPSTKNRDRKRDPDMSQTKKGNQWYFGMKAHIGVDADSGWVHSLEGTTAKVADCVMTQPLLHGEEQIVLGDRGYSSKAQALHAPREEGQPLWAIPFKRKPKEELSHDEQHANRILASLRAKVEHPFRVLKRQFGYSKVRYRGLSKNTAQLHMLFACVNLWLARERLLAAG
ncbi:MAG: IS5 family transposase [Stenotrophobium sp.]